MLFHSFVNISVKIYKKPATFTVLSRQSPSNALCDTDFFSSSRSPVMKISRMTTNNGLGRFDALGRGFNDYTAGFGFTTQQNGCYSSLGLYWIVSD